MGKLSRRTQHCALGQMIDARLLELRWVQDDLAQVLSVSSSYVSGIITGRKRISAETAKALEVALRISGSEMLRAQNAELLAAMPADPAKEATIMERRRQLEQRLAAKAA